MLSLLADVARSWVLVPAALVVLSVGMGRLVAMGAQDTRVRTLDAPIGFAALIVVTQLATASPRTAPLTVPGMVSLALAGWLLNPPRRLTRGRRVGFAPRAALAGAAVYAISFAPVLGFLRPTYLGWLTFNASSSYLAFGDQLLARGRSVLDVSPSTFESTVSGAIDAGQPMGAAAPVAAVARLLRVDSALVLQPYISIALAMFAIAAYSAVRTVGLRARVAQAAVTVAGSSALVLGVAWWGGINEAVMVALLATAVALIDDFDPNTHGTRLLLPLAVTVAAATAVYSPVAWLWLALPLWQLWRTYDGEALPNRRDDLTIAAVAVGVLAAPTLLAFGGLSAYKSLASTSQSLDDPGVLQRPLDLLQLAGIWPAGDIRTTPSAMTVTQVMAGLVLALAVLAVWRPRGAGTLPSLAVGAVALALLSHDGSAWVNGKAVVLASPFVLLMACDAFERMLRSARPVAGIVAGSVVAAGVTWSAAVAYREVWPAPYDQVSELRAIASQFDGTGPALMIEYNPLAGRHLLRNLDLDVAGDANSGQAVLVGGDALAASVNADLDDFTLQSVQLYPTLVLRNDPRASRPPVNFQPVFTGEFYTVWQADGQVLPPKAHIPLGSASSKGAVPECSTVTDAAASGSTKLVAAPADDAAVVDLSALELPKGWRAVETGVIPASGRVTFDVTVAATGEYTLWLGGWVRGTARVSIDGVPIAARSGVLNPAGSPTPFGTVSVEAGRHSVTIDYSAPLWRAGAGGVVDALGPFMIKPTADAAGLVTVPTSQAATLCGKAWDWIEVY